jgi:hypothetical protein
VQESAVVFVCSIVAWGIVFAEPEKITKNVPAESTPAHHIWSSEGPLTEPGSEARTSIALRFSRL